MRDAPCKNTGAYRAIVLCWLAGSAALFAGAQETGAGRAERVMKAFAAAYPNRVGPAEYRNGDWSVPIDGTRYYYADGRLLPEDLRARAAEYDPQPFYPYPADLPAWKDPGAEDDRLIRGMAERRRARPPKRSQHFHDALWQARTRAEAAGRVKTVRFLGRETLAHEAIRADLALVEEAIYAASRQNPEVRQWIAGLKTVSGWNWRSIAETQSRSFHAYGAAFDCIPQSPPAARETYWLWTSRTVPEWWKVPYGRRLHPPEPVIKAFEAQGFVWGGKWLFYDTMHFEYRPELFVLNGLPLAR
jgi:hypothetical protein